MFVWPHSPDGGALDVTGEILRPGEVSRPTQLMADPKIFVDHDGFDRYVVSIAAPDTEPGMYTLRLKLTEPGTNRSHASETSIRIER